MKIKEEKKNYIAEQCHKQKCKLEGSINNSNHHI